METKKSSKMAWLVGILLMLIALFYLYTWITLTWSYATGERAGYVQKLSKKGWVCKTWEGEMALVTIPGTVAEKFYFSIRDKSVVESINQSMGKRVIIVYDQHKGIPTSCFGETEYFAKAVKVIE